MMKMGHKSIAGFASRAGIILTVVAISVATALAANKEKVVYNFTGGSDGGTPAAMLTFDSQGNAYGTTVVGGADGYGSIFELTPESGGKWKLATLYSFTGGADGKNPYGGVTFDAKGNLYGTTVAGGSGGACSGDGCGVVYELSPFRGGWSQTVLYDFTGRNDGFGPGGPVVFDKSGNLYGTTPDGGSHAAGVVFGLGPHTNGQWTPHVILSCKGGKDGSTGSLGALLVDDAGNLYGIAELGGAHSAGVAFKLAPQSGGKWQFSAIYGFKGQPNAGSPYGGLIADAKGNLYGTTYFGGKNGLGSVFQLTPANGKYKESLLYSFQAAKDGNGPLSTLVFDAKGSLYGTASAGGDPGCGCGAIFKLSPSSGGKWKESVVHNFKGDPDGAYSNYGLTLDSKGNLFGVTALGGNQNQGAIFELVP
jgi:uncharacterized repeat protein (TIGR03803 family)